MAPLSTSSGRAGGADVGRGRGSLEGARLSTSRDWWSVSLGCPGMSPWDGCTSAEHSWAKGRSHLHAGLWTLGPVFRGLLGVGAGATNTGSSWLQVQHPQPGRLCLGRGRWALQALPGLGRAAVHRPWVSLPRVSRGSVSGLHTRGLQDERPGRGPGATAVQGRRLGLKGLQCQA